jgi:hypothetical protein
MNERVSKGRGDWVMPLASSTDKILQSTKCTERDVPPWAEGVGWGADASARNDISF